MNEELIRELDDFIALVTSNGWKRFVVILRKHQEYLQGKVNYFIADNNAWRAMRQQAKMENTDNVLDLLQKRMDELKTQKKEGGESDG